MPDRTTPHSFGASRASRLAPSPTGALHLGNARTFLINWALAKQQGWCLPLRIEDLDTPRIKPEAVLDTIETLRWLGLTWDGEPTRQSTDLAPYRAAADALAQRGMIYPSAHSRRDIERAASAPNEGDHETRFPRSLRPARAGPFPFDDRPVNWRLRVEPGPITIDDRVLGACSVDPASTVGDFAVWTKQGVPSYQLAVVVDDARQGVTDVVRGSDLLDSAGRQELLYAALDLAPAPRWWHLPLVRGEDGRRLAKRHGDTRLSTYRSTGVAAERIVALLARWSGIADAGPSMTAAAFAEAFRLSALPRTDICFSEEDHAWLVST